MRISIIKCKKLQGENQKEEIKTQAFHLKNQ